MEPAAAVKSGAGEVPPRSATPKPAERALELARAELCAAVAYDQINWLKTLLSAKLIRAGGNDASPDAHTFEALQQGLLHGRCGDVGSPLAVALLYGKEQAARWLLAAGAPSGYGAVVEAIMFALGQHDDSAAQRALALAHKLELLTHAPPLAGVLVAQVTRLSKTPFATTLLHVAARHNCAGTLCALLEQLPQARRAEAVHTLDGRGATPLHVASLFLAAPCVAPLCAAGARVSQLRVHPARSTGPVLMEVLRKWSEPLRHDLPYAALCAGSVPPAYPSAEQFAAVLQQLALQGADILAKDANGVHALAAVTRIAAHGDAHDARLRDGGGLLVRSLLHGAGLLTVGKDGNVARSSGQLLLQEAGAQALREALREAVSSLCWPAVQALLAAGCEPTMADFTHAYGALQATQGKGASSPKVPEADLARMVDALWRSRPCVCAGSRE